MKIHKLKIHTAYIPDIIRSIKTFEIRKNDRGFKTGDKLRLRGFNPYTQKYTEHVIIADITYILDKTEFGLQEGFVILGIKVVGDFIINPNETKMIRHYSEVDSDEIKDDIDMGQDSFILTLDDISPSEYFYEKEVLKLHNSYHRLSMEEEQLLYKITQKL